MGSPDFEILDESGANASAEFLERELLHALQSENEQSVNDRIVLTVRNQAEDIIAGLVGSTSYGWLLIKVLWVDRDYRGRSLGRNLVEAAENKAAGLGCHASWLDTSSESALEFYRAVGFETFGELANGSGQFPVSHRRWFLRRAIVT